MGEVVMVIGASGNGKTYSLRNFKRGECLVFNCYKNKFSFKGDLDKVNKATYSQIETALADPEIQNKYNTFIIDDSTFLMQLENFARCNEKGYDKFVQMSQHFQHLILTALTDTDDDTLVYLLHHPDTDDEGNVVPATAGKMLQKNFTIQGAVNIVLSAEVNNGEFKFKTNKDESHELCKSPKGMFAEQYIDNDLKSVDDAIRKYWQMAPRKEAK